MTAATPITTLAQMREKQQNVESFEIGFYNSKGFELLQRAAKLLAASTLVPPEFIGNLPNCVIAMNMANRIGADPLLVMQNLYVVHGRPGWSAKFLIASFNQCGRFTALRYEWQGERGKDDWGCRAWATEKATGEKIVGPLITIGLSKKEGWYDKKGSKWQTIPELMLTYRAAAWLVNTHAPEISMGLNTADELGDTFDASTGDDGTFQVTTESLREVVATVPAPKVEDMADDLPGPTVAQIGDAIQKATTVDALNIARDLIRHAPEEFRNELDADAAAKLAELSK